MNGMDDFIVTARQLLDPSCTGTLLQYKRNKRGQKIGLVIAFKENDQVYIGWSLCNLKKERNGFNKELGVAHAYRHAMPLDSWKSEYTWCNVPHTMWDLVLKMNERASAFFFKQERAGVGASLETPQKPYYRCFTPLSEECKVEEDSQAKKSSEEKGFFQNLKNMFF